MPKTVPGHVSTSIGTPNLPEENPLRMPKTVTGRVYASVDPKPCIKSELLSSDNVNLTQDQNSNKGKEDPKYCITSDLSTPHNLGKNSKTHKGQPCHPEAKIKISSE